MAQNLIKIPPYEYIHVLDSNENFTRTVSGPTTFVLKDHETITSGKGTKQMVKLSPYSFCEVKNPAIWDEQGHLVIDKNKQVKVNLGDSEYRYYQDWSEPFPLQPQEILVRQSNFENIPRDAYARIVAYRDFQDGEHKRRAGDEWLIKGPLIYLPRIEEGLSQIIHPIVIEKNTALRVWAKRACKDSEGFDRSDGEEWLVRNLGFYHPRIDEEVVDTVKAITITETLAVHLKAVQTFTDHYGIKWKAGEEWLITTEQSSTHIIDVYEQLVGPVNLTILNEQQYCYIVDPVDEKSG